METTDITAVLKYAKQIWGNASECHRTGNRVGRQRCCLFKRVLCQRRNFFCNYESRAWKYQGWNASVLWAAWQEVRGAPTLEGRSLLPTATRLWMCWCSPQALSRWANTAECLTYVWQVREGHRKPMVLRQMFGTTKFWPTSRTKFQVACQHIVVNTMRFYGKSQVWHFGTLLG